MRRLLGCLLVALTLASCQKPAAETHPIASETSAAVPLLPTEAEAAVTVDDVPIERDLTAFVVRRRVQDRAPMIFIPGMCVHPRDYMLTFRHAAAERGDLIAIQGDVSCGGDGYGRRWSNDLVAMNRRIDAAFAAAHLPPPRDTVIMGYSQGAERAERLVALFPRKYRAAVLIASPIAPSPDRLRGLRAVALMAGSLDRQPAMQAAVAPLRCAGVAAQFFVIPGARHGQMGDEPERTMGAALDFVNAPTGPAP